jgi:DNA-binding GntR family transcriptional regulator
MPKLSSSPAASQREQAYRALRRLLVLQQIEPGKRLREPEWAQRLHVHRTALREAFARLEAEGFIQRGARTGYFVPELSAQDLLEVTKLRLAFECLAIDELCASKSADLSALHRATEELERFVKGEYSLAVLEADRRFHEALIDAARMQRLSTLYHRAPLPLIHGDTEDRLRWISSCARTLSEHRQILSALQARDAKQAKTILRTHLTHQPMLPVCR